MNKFGEIIFDDDGNVLEVNGYNGDRKNFEFVELSEYYSKLQELEDILDDIKSYTTICKQLIREIT